jgi:indole-3-glycerol phosphate synthase
MILDTIIEHKREEVAILLRDGFARPELDIPPPRSFRQALLDYPGVAIIAEAKKASPSKGVIRPDFEPVAIARSYELGGAQAMSVLTDERFFQGSLAYIPQVRLAVDLPVLRKDFIVHEVQIQQAKVYGADAILLIVAVLDQVQIRDYLDLADELELDALVEVHDEQELEIALAAGSSLVGVNNRNLKDFTLDLETTFRLQRLMPPDVPLVSESGIRAHADYLRLGAAKVTAALVGEAFMREADPGQALARFRNGDQPG